jgi:hypothetical protein
MQQKVAEIFYQKDPPRRNVVAVLHPQDGLTLRGEESDQLEPISKISLGRKFPLDYLLVHK